MPQEQRKRFKVNRAGVLSTTKAWAHEQGLSPGDEVDQRDLVLRRKGHTRRAILRYVGAASAGAAAVGFGADVLSLADHFDQRFTRRDEEISTRLGLLVGAGEAASVALMPSRYHPFQPWPGGAEY